MKRFLVASAVAMGLAVGSAAVAFAGSLPSGVTSITGEAVNQSGTPSVPSSTTGLTVDGLPAEFRHLHHHGVAKRPRHGRVGLLSDDHIHPEQ